MLTSNQILKAGVAGLIAGIIMFIPMMYLVKVAGIAPFNVPPSKALAMTLNIDVAPFVAPVLHFLYGIAGAIVFAVIFKPDLSVLKALLFSGAMWLILMLVYSPVIGWGLFGFGEAQTLPQDHPLHLGPAPKFIIATLGFHILYGLVMGFSAKKLINFK